MNSDLNSEIGRKLFHLTGLIYVAGFVFIPRSTYLVLLTVLIVLVGLFELIRLRIPSVQQFAERLFGSMIREKEKRHISGIFWMMLGVLGTALLIETTILAVTAILFLLFGDGLASVGGKFLKGPTWGRSEKRISGSLACLVICLIIGVVLLRERFGMSGVFLGSAVATLAEGLPTSLDDNTTIPIVSSIAFLVCYDLNPYFMIWF